MVYWSSVKKKSLFLCKARWKLILKSGNGVVSRDIWHPRSVYHVQRPGTWQVDFVSRLKIYWESFIKVRYFEASFWSDQSWRICQRNTIQTNDSKTCASNCVASADLHTIYNEGHFQTLDESLRNFKCHSLLLLFQQNNKYLSALKNLLPQNLHIIDEQKLFFTVFILTKLYKLKSNIQLKVFFSVN